MASIYTTTESSQNISSKMLRYKTRLSTARLGLNGLPMQTFRCAETLTYRISRGFLLMAILMMLACEKNDSSYEPGNISVPLPQQLAAAVNILPSSQIAIDVVVDEGSNKKVVLPLKNAQINDNKFTGTVKGLTNGPHKIKLVYWLTVPDITINGKEIITINVLETSEIDVTMSNGQGRVSFNSALVYLTDDDSDYRSNLYEIIKGMDWTNADEFPAKPEGTTVTVEVNGKTAAVSWQLVGEPSQTRYTIYYSKNRLDPANINEFATDDSITKIDLNPEQIVPGGSRNIVSMEIDNLNILDNYNLLIVATEGEATGGTSNIFVFEPQAGRSIPKDFTVTAGIEQVTISYELDTQKFPLDTEVDLYMQSEPGVVRQAKNGELANKASWMLHKNIDSPYVHKLINGSSTNYYFTLVARMPSGKESLLSDEIIIQPESVDLRSDQATKKLAFVSQQGVPNISADFSLLNPRYTSFNIYCAKRKNEDPYPNGNVLTDNIISNNRMVINIRDTVKSINRKNNNPGTISTDSCASPYTFRIVAVDDTGELSAQASTIVGVEENHKLPSPIVHETAQAVINDDESISWRISWYPVTGADRYKLYLQPNDVTPTLISKVNATKFEVDPPNGIMAYTTPGTDYVHPPLSEYTGRTFDFVVTAFNDYGESIASNLASVLIVDDANSLKVTVPNLAALPAGSAVGSAVSAIRNADLLHEVIVTQELGQNSAVEIVSQTPASGTVAKNSVLQINVTIPPDSGETLLTPSDAANILYDERYYQERAAAYYTTVDPVNERDTFDKWLTTNDFFYTDLYGETFESVHASVTYFNQRDYDLARVVRLKQHGSGRYSLYANNYSNMTDALSGQNLKSTFAIEISPPPSDATLAPAVSTVGPASMNYVKFYAYGPGGIRIDSVDLDGRGEKYLPGVCMVCHGGIPYPTVTDTSGAQKFPHAGNVESRLIPFDLESMRFPELTPLNRVAQEKEFLQLNKVIRDSYGSDAVTVSMLEPSKGVIVPVAIVDCIAEISGVCTPSVVDARLPVYGIDGQIDDVEIIINDLEHPNLNDLQIAILSPTGTQVDIVPAQSLDSGIIKIGNMVLSSAKIPALKSAFAGQSVTGYWTLRIRDHSADPSVSSIPSELRNWTLNITSKAQAVELIEGWYGDSDLNGNFNSNFIPRGWRNNVRTLGGSSERPAYLYNEVIKKNCRVCHVQRGLQGSRLGFASYADFTKLELVGRGASTRLQYNSQWLGMIEKMVYVEGGMPRSKLAFERFWLSQDALTEEKTQPLILGGFLSSSIDTTTGPGKPIANAGRGDHVIPATAVTLDGSRSLFADTFSWTLISSPGASASFTSNEIRPTFTPMTEGEYIFTLIVSNGILSSEPAIVKVFASADPAVASFTKINNEIFQVDCIQCHRPGGIADHTGFNVDTDIESLFTTVKADGLVDFNSLGNSRILRPSSPYHGGNVRPGFDLKPAGDPVIPPPDRSRYDKIFDWLAYLAANRTANYN